MVEKRDACLVSRFVLFSGGESVGMNKQQVIAQGKIAAAMIIIGSFVVINKIITGIFPVFLASELRLALGAAILGVILYAKERKVPSFSRKDLGVLFVQSFIGVFLFSIFLLYGLRKTTALESGIITSLTPAVVGLISFVLLREKIERNRMIGIVLAVMGILVMNIYGNLTGTEQTASSLAGNALIICAVIGEAVFLTFSKFVSKQISALAISFMTSGIGALLFLPFAIMEAKEFAFSSVTTGQWMLVVYTGVGVTVLATILYNQGIRYVPASTAAILSALMPISAVVFSCIVLGESIHAYHVFGFACVLLGLRFLGK